MTSRGDGVQHLGVRRRRDVDSVVVGQSASGGDLGRGAGEQGAVRQPAAGGRAEIVASVLAHDPGDVGDGLRLLVGQPAEVAAGEAPFHQRFGAGELAVEVQIEGTVAGQIGVHQRRRVSGRVRASVAAIGNGAPSREVGVGPNAARAPVGRFVHQVAGPTAHRPPREGARARPALRQLEVIENRVARRREADSCRRRGRRKTARSALPETGVRRASPRAGLQAPPASVRCRPPRPEDRAPTGPEQELSDGATDDINSLKTSRPGRPPARCTRDPRRIRGGGSRL